MTASGGFVPLTPADPPGAHAGCALALGALLLAIGGGAIGLFILRPEGMGQVWVTPVVGGLFALVGAVLLYAGLRGARGLKIAPPEVSIGRRDALQPGETVMVRLRQPGPVRIASLKLRACCERVYQRRVQEDGAAVPDREVIWEQALIDVRDERVAASRVLEREAMLALPSGMPPTGPATRGGRIRWQLDVWVDAGWLRATYRAFEVEVRAAAAVAAPPAPNPAESGGTGAPGLSLRFGCLFIAAGFLLTAAAFIWMFFSGAAFSGSGNPYMALFAGVLFGVIGLVALAAVALSLLPSSSCRPD